MLRVLVEVEKNTSDVVAGVKRLQAGPPSWLDARVASALELVTEPNEDSRRRAIEILREVMPNLSVGSTDYLNASRALAKAYQSLGQHRQALQILQNTPEYSFRELDRALSLSSLGDHEVACDAIDKFVASDGFRDLSATVRSLFSLDIGKIFHAAGRTDRAVHFYEQARRGLELDQSLDGRSHYARATSNLGFILLKNSDASLRDIGLALIEQASDIKAKTGDLEGLGTNFNQLGIHYRAIKRYQRALVYARRDLSISKTLGDQRGIASSLVNLADLYSELMQLTAARQISRQAKEIADALKDDNLARALHGLDTRIDAAGREAGTRGDTVGPAAFCECKSGKQYQYCCGLADFEPEDIPQMSLEVSKGAENIRAQLKGAGVKPVPLDYILRTGDRVRERHAFTQVRAHDGWVSIDELPDMANLHFMSAEALAEEAQNETDSITKPVACVVMAVCGLEAFINQVAFWMAKSGMLSSQPGGAELPDEFVSDPLAFQRTTSLSRKWQIVGGVLMPQFWPPPDPLLSNFGYLVDLRNEIVHFKSTDYEQVIPKPKTLHSLIRRAPADIEIRNIPRSWPNRLFTPSLAKWSIKTADEVVTYFKEKYRIIRLKEP